MKRTLILLLALFLIFSMSISTLASDAGKGIGIMPGTSDKLTLDGKMETVYKNSLHINKMYSHDGKATPVAKTDFYLVYDKDAIWIFCEVVDATLTTKAADPAKPSYAVDSIEIMLDMTNKGENIPDQTPYQCRIDHNNLISGRLGQKGTSLFLRKSEGGTIEFFDAVAVRTDNGFNAEFRIPFDKAPEKGAKIGLNLCYNDWDKDGGTRIFQVSTEGVSSWKAESFDYVTLGEITKVKSGITSAAQTADPFIVTSISVLISRALILRKKHKSA